MKRTLVLLAVLSVTVALIANAATQPTKSSTTPSVEKVQKEQPVQPAKQTSPYGKALKPTPKPVPMACQNRACNDPETCGVFTLGRKCTDGGGVCVEEACD